MTAEQDLKTDKFEELGGLRNVVNVKSSSNFGG